MASAIVAAVVISLAVFIGLRSRSKTKCLPPGPPGELLLGNARQIQLTSSWFYYTDLAKKYGDVVYLDLAGQCMVVLSSLQAIEDLVVKKSSICSARPILTMVSDLVGLEHDFAIVSPGPRFTVYRKLAHQWLGPLSVARWDDFLESEMRDCVGRALRGPHVFLKEFQFSIARMMLDKTYGKSPKGHDDEDVYYAEESTIAFGLASQPGRFLVDSFPLLKYVPAWFPFAGFKTLAKKWRADIMRGVGPPFEQVKTEIAAGVEKDSFVSQSLRNPPVGATDDMIKWAAGSLYGGSVDTTTGAISTFLLNMVLHPEIQEKGRAEIYRVIGTDRLPAIADREKLPYVEAILKEVLRWHPIVPTVPYRSVEEFKYRDWIIPKGAMIMANIWAIARDPKVYPRPEEFIPERFVKQPDLLDPRKYFFGFGRRLCPGQYFADAVLWVTIATILATTDISKALDDSGREITPGTDYRGALACTPEPFPYVLNPASNASKSLLEASNGHE